MFESIMGSVCDVTAVVGRVCSSDEKVHGAAYMLDFTAGPFCSYESSTLRGIGCNAKMLQFDKAQLDSFGGEQVFPSC